MAKLVWANSALDSLNNVAEYIALDNAIAAKALVEGVLSAVERLESFPESGRVVPELDGFEYAIRYRELIYKPCRIIYRYDLEQNTVYIVGLLRQEMDLLRYVNTFISTQ